MLFLRTLIVAFVVTGVLDLLAKKSRKKTGSMKKFVVRAPLDFAGLGTIGMIIVIGALVFAEVENQDIPLPIMVIFIVVAIGPSFLLMIAPIKGVWDIIVDGDDITVVKAFLFKSHWKFSNITCGRATRGGTKIYVEGRKRKAFFVDGMCEGYSNFLKRMEKEDKKIIYPAGMEKDADGGLDEKEEVNEE